MTLSAGTRLGPYEILSPLGAGGMGEVYRARDTRLERTVAVKVLSSQLSSSPESRQRFEREAKTISQLSHPHICALYDVGREGETEYLVMELLEGETLSERLAKGALPLDQTLRFGAQIADALDKAHRQGIVHRDLKPGNVMITKSGVKLLDFGLAKAYEAPATKGSLTALPTKVALTQEGTILGTFQYMAPEQLEGKEADARTDIFALGAVLYEMATGKKAFTGSSQASLITAIMSSDPPAISAVQPMSPPALDRVVKTCIAKDPEDRWQSAGDLKRELKWTSEGGSQAGLPAPLVTRGKARAKLPWTIAAVTSLGLLTVATLLLRNQGEPGRMFQSSILPPEKSAFTGAMELSPDGQRIAFVAPLPGGADVLWVRPLNGLAAQPLAGTEGASFPFWSPDSRFVGFFADGKLRKIEASGGPPQTLCDAAMGRGGTWNRDGVILFTPSTSQVVFRVSSSGGTVSPATELPPGGQRGHRWPSFLPDGKHFLYLALGAMTAPADAGIYVGALDSKERKLLLPSRSSAAYVEPGYLLFYRENTLLARPFDARRLRFTGEAFPVAERVRSLVSRKAVFSVSNSGVLAYQAGEEEGGRSQLVWLDRSGKQVEKVAEPANYRGLRLSHDGRRIAFSVDDNRSADLWLHDLSRRSSVRFTFDPANEFSPAWSPDDRRIAFTSSRTGPGDLYWKNAAGTGPDEPVLVSNPPKFVSDWSSDGRFLAFYQIDPKTGDDLWIFSIADGKASPYLRTQSAESEARFSPDGRFLAYVSNETGADQVYVQQFPGPGGKWQISTSGGLQPVWSKNGRELFYFVPPNRLMSVEVRGGEAFEAGVPRLLFETRILGGPGRLYDVSPDAQRFLVVAPTSVETNGPITLVVNWTAGLKKP